MSNSEGESVGPDTTPEEDQFLSNALQAFVKEEDELNLRTLCPTQEALKSDDLTKIRGHIAWCRRCMEERGHIERGEALPPRHENLKPPYSFQEFKRIAIKKFRKEGLNTDEVINICREGGFTQEEIEEILVIWKSRK